MDFTHPILKRANCDDTIKDVLDDVVFQNSAGNLLVSYSQDTTNVYLNYKTKTVATAPPN